MRHIVPYSLVRCPRPPHPALAAATVAPAETSIAGRAVTSPRASARIAGHVVTDPGAALPTALHSRKAAAASTADRATAALDPRNRTYSIEAETPSARAHWGFSIGRDLPNREQ